MKSSLKRIWRFIWEDDSILSWIVNIILAFVLIKYIIFPVLGAIFGTQYPLVAVVSSSMEHDGKFDAWWNSPAACGSFICKQLDVYNTFNISKEQFRTFIFKNGFEKGDVMVLMSAKNINLGDVIVFFSKDGRPIIHRVVKLNPLQTKGDHNAAQINDNYITESNIAQHPIVGKAVLRIPLIGYVKVGFAYVMSFFGVRVA